MRKLILLTLFVTAPTFASSLILSKYVSTGNVLPQYSFTKDCKIYNDGHATITTRNASGPTTVRHRSISYGTVYTIQGLVRVAQRGRLANVGATCDGGNMFLDGYNYGVKVILDESKDCGTHVVNQSRATYFLRNWAKSICGF